MSSYPVGLWRVPSPTIKNGKYGSLIVDSGQLRKAVAASDNNFLFAEAVNDTPTEATKPLAIIGTLAEIANFLIENRSRKVLNKIKGLNSIYIGLTKYAPGNQFSGLFPLQDFGVKFFTQIISFYPDLAGLKVPPFVELAGLPGTIKELLEAILKIKSDDDKNAKASNIYFLKISYLPEDEMIEYKKNELSFAELLNLLKVGGTQAK